MTWELTGPSEPNGSSSSSTSGPWSRATASPMRLVIPSEKSAIMREDASPRSNTRSRSADRRASTSRSVPRSIPAYGSISTAVSRPHSTGLSGTNPNRALAAVGSGQTSTAAMVALPTSGASNPVSIRIVVVLPAPLGPANP